jgi:hypothetical protein
MLQAARTAARQDQHVAFVGVEAFMIDTRVDIFDENDD